MQLFSKIIVAIFATALFSCGKESSCLKSSGNTKTEIRSLSTLFTQLKIEDNINLILTQSNDIKLKVEAGENLLPYITTTINNGVLEIVNENKCNFLRNYNKPINVYLSVPNLTEVYYNGKGSLSSVGTLTFSKLTIETVNGTGKINLDLLADEVRLITHSGATEFTVRGTTNKLFVFSGASSYCYLSALTANVVHVNNAGVGDISVDANTSLLVELTSLGNIKYTGSPTITISTLTGSGQLINNN